MRRALGIAWMGLGIGIALASASPTAADPRASIGPLAGGLPAGWTAAIEGDELVLRRAATVRISARHQPELAHQTNIYVAPRPSARPVTLALRYRLEPAWDEARLAAAREANAQVHAAIAAARTRHGVDRIAHAHGRPLPRGEAEQRRVEDFEAEAARLRTKLVALPRCRLGAHSLFDVPSTFETLQLIVDPPIAMREAYAVVELLKRRCR